MSIATKRRKQEEEEGWPMVYQDATIEDPSADRVEDGCAEKFGHDKVDVGRDEEAQIAG